MTQLVVQSPRAKVFSDVLEPGQLKTKKPNNNQKNLGRTELAVECRTRQGTEFRLVQ